MSLYLDTKYLLLVSNRIPHFKKIDENTYNGRCIICGDSKRSETKCRLYFYVKNNGIRVFCHNCGYSSSLQYFLKRVDEQLYQQYTFEALRDSRLQHELVEQATTNIVNSTIRSTRTICTSDKIVDSVLDYGTRVDKLDQNHCCVQYVAGRQIPHDKWNLLYYTDDFKSFVNNIIPGKFKSDGKDILSDRRLIIPYFDNHGKCFAFQGRSLEPDAQIRYFTIKIDKDKPPVYGLDRIDYSKTIYCTEGPIDSLFLDNCIAVSGSHYQDPLIDSIKSTLVVVPDNERRNKQVTKQLGTLIKKGYKVCLWPDNLPFKDINEAILKGYDKQQLMTIINQNIVSGLSGQVKFKLWVK